VTDEQILAELAALAGPDGAILHGDIDANRKWLAEEPECSTGGVMRLTTFGG
jgi:hypothetical protein